MVRNLGSDVGSAKPGLHATRVIPQRACGLNARPMLMIPSVAALLDGRSSERRFSGQLGGDLPLGGITLKLGNLSVMPLGI